jgi:RHS repeat-associated protein
MLAFCFLLLTGVNSHAMFQPLERTGVWNSVVSDALGDAVARTQAAAWQWTQTNTTAYGGPPPQEGLADVSDTLEDYTRALSWRGRMGDLGGMVYLGARYYDPRTRSFVSTDPLDYLAGPNLYSYAAGDPINLTDPDGRLAKAAVQSVSNLHDRFQITKLNVEAETLKAYQAHPNMVPLGDPFSSGTYVNLGMAATAIPSIAKNLLSAPQIAANKTPVFWSGGRAAEDAARTFANANNGIIVGDTVAGRALAQSTAGMPWSQARPQWLSLSEDFAQSASGQVNVFQNARGVALDSIWRNEYQILRQNNVQIIFNVVMPNGSTVPVP